MLSLSQTTGYAILALAYLAERPQCYSLAQDIAQETGISKPYLSKMLHSLAQKGLIHSKRGVKGGLVLSRPPEKISILDILRAVEGEALNDHCVLGLLQCSSECPCPMHSYWSQERRRIERRFARTSLAQVILSVRQGWGL
jgi:Rrf2 family transcriptional regulator, iron-sulfur cluster assembly transcription factor